MDKQDSAGLIGRDDEIRTFESLLRKLNQAAILRVYGPGGIGKSTLIQHFRQYCIRESVAVLSFDWEMSRKNFLDRDQIDAIEFWQNVKIGNAGKTRSVFLPKRFFLIRKYISINPQNQDIEVLVPSLKDIEGFVRKETENDTAMTWLAKISWAVLKFLVNFRKKQIAENPEKIILEELIQYAKDKPFVFLLDNHDLAHHIQINTRLNAVNSVTPADIQDDNFWNSKPQPISFAEYLERFHAALCCTPKLKWISVITGRAELPPMHSIDLKHLPKAIHLSAFSQIEIRRLLESEQIISDYLENSPEKHRQLNQTASGILRATSGNPLLVRLSVRLIAESVRENTENLTLDAVWEKEIERFRKHPKWGLHLYLTERLIERIRQNERIKDRLWRLALPYQLIQDEKLEEILFPKTQGAETSSPFEILSAIGILQPEIQQPFKLHLVSHLALSEAASEHESECIAIHQELEKYFEDKQDNIAVHFHRLCGKERKTLTECGISPEEYWELVTASFSLKDSDKKRYRFEPLPQKPALKKRVSKLLQEKNTFGTDLCGDAAAFLRQKFRQGGLQMEQLNDKAVLKKLIQEAPHLSDLHYKLAMLETDMQEKYRLLEKIIAEINPGHAYAWWEKAMAEMADGKRDTAAQSFTQAIAYGVIGFHFNYANGWMAWMQADHSQAEAFLRKAYRINPERLPIREDLAALLIFCEKYDDAIEILEKAKQKTQRTQFLQIEACYRAEKYDEIEKLIPETEETDSWEYERIQKRYEDIQRKKTENNNMPESNGEAFDEEACRTAVETSPNDPIAWAKLGAALYFKGQIDEAIETYRKAIRFKPDGHEAWFCLGAALYFKGQIDEAIETYQKAIRFKPDEHAAWFCLGVALKDKGQYNEAIEAYRKAIRFKPDDHAAWNNLGVALYDKGQYKEAIEAYQKAIQFNPNLYQAWYNLGLVMSHKGQLDEAIRAYQKAIQFKPDDHEAWNNLGIAFDRLFDQIQESRNTEQIFASDIRKLHRLKILSEKCKNISLAIQALPQNQNKIELQMFVAKNVWLPYQKWQEAKSCIDKVLEQEPQHLEALVIQSEIDLATGNPATATALLNEYDSIDFESLDKQSSHDIKLRFVNLFESIGNTDKAIECLTSAYVDDIDRDTCEYHHARILWEKHGDLTKPKEILKRLLRYPTPQVYILDADIALHTGDFVRCGYSLEKAESCIDFGLMPLKDIRKWEELQEMCL